MGLIEEKLERVTIKFAGDSGDGVQIMGNQFGNVTAISGNDFATQPDYPAEIRAPRGTLAGVSSYQIQFAAYDIYTPGDQPDVLVAFNPAALKVNLPFVKKGGIILLNEDEFTPRNMEKAQLSPEVLEGETLNEYRVYRMPISKLTREAVQDVQASHADKERCRNFFSLGVMCWLFSRPLQPIEDFLHQKFSKKPEILEANLKALKAGYNIGDTMELFHEHYQVPRAKLDPGLYRNITGAQATAYGLVVAAQKAGLPLVYTGYPITPASEVLHTLSALKQYGVVTAQAEDEIAGICMAIGASYAGKLGVTGTSGPGLALKIEALNLAVMVELPLVVFDFQRGGISTGLPTKTEQGDLLFTLFGRPSDSHVILLAPATPSDCFFTSIEAVKLAVKYMTPVVVLSDQYLVHSSEPWRVPDLDAIPSIPVKFRVKPEGFYPYMRDKHTFARPWVALGTPELEHTIGGLEKGHLEGHVSYDPENHDFMTHIRAEKVRKAIHDIPEVKVTGNREAKLVVVGWGSTYGHIRAAVEMANENGMQVAQVHLRHLNPLPPNTLATLQKFQRVLVPELNLGQLSWILRAKGVTQVEGYNRVTGKPFSVAELFDAIQDTYRALQTTPMGKFKKGAG